jgi:hypothetical protein
MVFGELFSRGGEAHVVSGIDYGVWSLRERNGGLLDTLWLEGYKRIPTSSHVLSVLTYCDLSFYKKRKQVKDTWIKESQNECPALTCLYFRNLVEFAFMHKKECGKECMLLCARHKKPDTAPHALAKNVWTLTTCFLCSCCSSTLFKVFLAWVCSIVVSSLK